MVSRVFQWSASHQIEYFPPPPQVGKSSKPSREPVFQAPLKMTTSVDENHESEGGVVEPLQQPLQALRSEK